MTGTWMAYALAVSTVALLAGLGAERALERLDLPTRGIWITAMLLGVLLPAGALLRAPPPPSPLAAGPALGVGDLAFAGISTLTALPPEPRITPDAALLAGWGALSLLFALALGWSALSLERTRRRWRRAVVAGSRAWISERTGPAVVGFLRPEIVLPAWVLEWDPALKRLIVTHEREHVRAGDGRLLLAGLLLLCAAPWNLALWWQWRRLRQAVEMDCDRRVLRAEPDVRRYGRLLLEVAERTRRHALPMAAFAESRSSLERRIRMMTNRRARNRAGWALAVAVSLVAAPVALLALPAPAPVGVDGVRGVVAGWVGSVDADREIRKAPLRRHAGFVAPAIRPTPAPPRTWHGDTALLEIAKPVRAAITRDTVPARAKVYEVAQLDRKPVLTNKSQVQAMLSRYYPRMLQDAGIGGTAMMQYVITPEGTVDPSTVKVVSTTHEQFAEASEKVVERFRFIPGEYRGNPVYVIIQMPIAWAAPTRPAAGAAAGAVTVGSPSGSARIPTPALLAIREIVTQRYPDFVGKATGTRKVLLVVVHPDARVEHTSLANGYMDPNTLRDSDLVPGVTGDRIDRVDVMTSPDLGSIAKDLDSVIWVTLKS